MTDNDEMIPSLKKKRGRLFAIRAAFITGFLIWLFSPRLPAQEFKVVPLGYWPAAKERLELIVDEDWSDEAGIRKIPFRLRFASGNPGTQDHTFQLLTFNARGLYRDFALQRLDSQEVTIPAGSTAVEGRILIPQSRGENNFDYALTEPGAKFSSPTGPDRRYRYYGRNVGMPDSSSLWLRASVILHSELPDFDERLQNFESSAQRGAAPSLGSQVILGGANGEKLPLLPRTNDSNQSVSRGAAAVNSFLDWKKLKKLHIDEADADWLSYSCFQQMLITVEDARQLQENEPLRWQAIRNWLATGGVLLMLETGEQFEKRDQVEELFNFAGTEDRIVDDWFAVNVARIEANFVDVDDAAAHQNTPPLRNGPLLHHFRKIRRVENDEQIDSWRPEFLLHPYGLGIIVLADDAARSGAWNKLSVFACERYPDLQSHAGFTLESSAEPDLLQIPGVGDPPVNAFRILITLFFAIVGPLNYFLLRSQRRLHLILFTLPAFALLACVGLILYSLFADGIQTRGRIISYSEIDQHAHQLVSYSRQAYYSPLAAEGALVYGLDTAVFPVVSDREYRPFQTKIGDGVQTLSGGNLQARVENQFLAIRSCPTEAGLEPIDEKKMQFRNHLGGKIQIVFMRNAAGEFFLAEQLETGEVGTAMPCSMQDAAVQLDACLKDVRADLSVNMSRQPLRNVTMPHDVILESLRQDISQLEYNSYLAILDNSTEIPVLQPKALFEASLNIIRGNW